MITTHQLPYVSTKAKADYAADPEKFRQRVLAYQRANPQWANERNARHRARIRSATIGKVTVKLLAAKAAFWGDRCWMCGGEWTDWDHVKPLAKLGPHMLANLRPACDPCNSSKGDRWPLAKALLAGRRAPPLVGSSESSAAPALRSARSRA